VEPFDSEDRVASAGVEVERPAAGVVGRPGDAHGDDVLETEDAAHEDRPVRPRACPAHVSRYRTGTIGFYGQRLPAWGTPNQTIIILLTCLAQNTWARHTRRTTQPQQELQHPSAA